MAAQIGFHKPGMEFLSNFYPFLIVFNGFAFRSAEHAYQADKCEYAKDFDKIRFADTPGRAKRMGRKVKMRQDFNPDEVMYNVLVCKYSYQEMRDKLLMTGDMELVEENTWNDTYWGVCNGVGENKLGKMLMQIRSDIKNDRIKGQ